MLGHIWGTTGLPSSRGNRGLILVKTSVCQVSFSGRTARNWEAPQWAAEGVTKLCVGLEVLQPRCLLALVLLVVHRVIVPVFLCPAVAETVNFQPMQETPVFPWSWSSELAR